MQSIRQIQRLNDAELEKCVPSNASWHTDYRDTAYIYIGGLPFELSEGDVLLIASQYGNPVHVRLVRDKETGKSRGFAFLKYEDQRSCDLAVDNLSGAGVLGRVLQVDHTRYKLTEGEIEGEGLEEEAQDDTDSEAEKRRKRRRNDGDDDRPKLAEEVELAKLLKEHDDDDPMKAYLVKEKREEIAEALKRMSRVQGGEKKERKHRHRHDSNKERSEHRKKHRSRDRTDNDEDLRSRNTRDRIDDDQDSRSRNGLADRTSRKDNHNKRRKRSRSISSAHSDRPRRNRERKDYG